MLTCQLSLRKIKDNSEKIKKKYRNKSLEKSTGNQIKKNMQKTYKFWIILYK